jgi:hypothetical protein
MMSEKQQCMMCENDAVWMHHTQFAGSHPYCDSHARKEGDFGESHGSYQFWENLETGETTMEKEKETKKKLFMVETVSMFRLTYVIEAESAEHAADEVVMNTSGAYDENFQEFSQKHLDEVIVSTRPLKRKDYIKTFDEYNDYLSNWTEEQKLRYINKIDYDKYKKDPKE